MNLLLHNSTALVTAATDSIGIEIVHSLAEEGARVIVNGCSSASVDAVLETVRLSRPAARLERLVADLATEDGCLKAINSFPEVDILVNKIEFIDGKGLIADAEVAARDFSDPRISWGLRLSRHYLSWMRQDNGGRLVFLLIGRPPQALCRTGLLQVLFDPQSESISNLAGTTGRTDVAVNTVISACLQKRTGWESPIGFRTRSSRRWEKQLSDADHTSWGSFRRTVPTNGLAALVTFLCSPRSSAIQNSTIRINLDADWTERQPR